MIKQISLELIENCVIAKMNEQELFRVDSSNKTIDVEDLYKKLDIKREDVLENLIQKNDKVNQNALSALFDNTSLFLNDLIKRIQEVLESFNVEKEEKSLIDHK